MLNGTIQSLTSDKGFAFIRPEVAGPDVFVHRSTVDGGEFAQLQVGHRVTYEIDAKADRPRASRVVLVPGQPAAPRPPESNHRGPQVRPGQSAKPGQPARPGQSTRPGRSSRAVVAPEDAVRGFVTKMRIHDEEPHGYVSADAGGHEVRFEPLAVQGETRFTRLKVGDYVEFAFDPETRATREPTARFVQQIERVIRMPQMQMSRHPNSRRKKPSWRG